MIKKQMQEDNFIGKVMKESKLEPSATFTEALMKRISAEGILLPSIQPFVGRKISFAAISSIAALLILAFFVSLGTSNSSQGKAGYLDNPALQLNEMIKSILSMFTNSNFISAFSNPILPAILASILLLFLIDYFIRRIGRLKKQ